MTTSSRPAEEGVLESPAGLRAGLPELICAFSLSLDAAEGREPGHAIRVAYVTKLLAAALDLDRDQRWAALSAGLLHDVGVPAAVGLLTGVPGADEEALFRSAPTAQPAVTEGAAPLRERVGEALRLHVSAGASFLSQPWFPAATFEAVRSHHENWDGSGYPDQLAGAAIPPLARILRAADLFEAVVAGEANPLHARARARAVVQQWSGREIDPSVAEALETVLADDRFWLGFYDEALGEVLVEEAAGEGVPPSTKLLWAFSESVAAMVDAKADHQPGRAVGVMRLARDLGEAIHLPPMRLDLLALAAYWLDVGRWEPPSASW